MEALLTAARIRLDEASTGALSDSGGAAIMAMYDALMSTLTADERSLYVDHPNAAAVRLAVKRLALTTNDAESAVRFVELYYLPDRTRIVALADAVRLARRVLEAARG